MNLKKFSIFAVVFAVFAFHQSASAQLCNSGIDVASIAGNKTYLKTDEGEINRDIPFVVAGDKFILLRRTKRIGHVRYELVAFTYRGVQDQTMKVATGWIEDDEIDRNTIRCL